MQIIRYPKKEKWDKILQRPSQSYDEIKPKIASILLDIKREGDKAVKKYCELYDNVVLSSLSVLDDELSNLDTLISNELKQAIQLAYDNITKFHVSQLNNCVQIETSPGVKCWNKLLPIEKVGLYIPGGTAPLFSTILMLAIPAKLAGCQEIILCTPPNKNGSVHPAILYAAKLTGVNKIYKIGGAQAIAAMAYGTETIEKVYKIFGPGNQYVTAAKQLVLNKIAIDMPAGPSEIAVVADKTGNPVFIAADLLSQAEHGVDSQAIFITDSEKLAKTVNIEIEKQLELLPRKDIASVALTHSMMIIVNNMDEAIELVNYYAPEHLILMVEHTNCIVNKVINAGSVFIGKYSTESAGDYCSGTNHVLPTYGFARNYSGVSTESFMKKVTFQEISREGLKIIGPAIEVMACAEELQAHKNAVTVRLNEINSSEKTDV